MKTKQVIIIRKDLKMRRGKECAQASHAAMAFLTKNGIPITIDPRHIEEVTAWVNNSFRKITCSVDSEAELMALHNKALETNLVSSLITDSGLTEFKGIPTHTCIAIGPHEEGKFSGITDGLKLY